MHDKAYGSTEAHYPKKTQSIVGNVGKAECTHTGGHCEAVCTTPRCSSRISCQGDISISPRRLQTFAHSTWLRAAGGGRAGARRPLSASARTAGGDNAALSIPALPPLSFPKEPVQQACALGSVKPTGSNLNCHCGGCKSLDEPCHPSCLIFLGAVLSTHLAVARSKGGDRCRAEGLSPGQCGINTCIPLLHLPPVRWALRSDLWN